MKKTHKKILLGAFLATFAFSAFAFTACDDKDESSNDSSSSSSSSSTSSSDSSSVAVLELSKTEAELVLGNDMLLIAICDDAEMVTWSSSNPAIVSVEDGVITANDVGEATITATYGEYTESCRVTVGLGDIQPVLTLKSYLGEEVVPFTVGTGYALNAVVSFNGKEYACEPQVTIDGDDTIIYADGKVNATGEGAATVTVSTVWKGVDTSLLTTQIKVRALKPIFITPFVTYADSQNAIATNDIELSIVEEWCGKSYNNSADVEFKAEIDGVESVLTDVAITKGDDLVSYDAEAGEITAKPNKRGTAVLTATYETDGYVYARDLTVNVVCPIEEYTDLFEFDASKNFPTELFGVGASVKEAWQGNKNVSPAKGRKQLQGVFANGYDTEPIEVYTTKGAYRFTNLFAYTMKLTQTNFVNTLSLEGKNSVLSGYYYLSEDVTVNMTTQLAGSKDVYFEGVFDGSEHTVNASVGQNGIFGHLGGDASIRNTHFNFTFASSGMATGLARNADISVLETLSVQANERLDITLQNLYVTSTNYTATSYALMGEMPYFLAMTDVYVNIDVGEETSGAGSERAALFKMDRSLYNSVPAGSFRPKAFKNVYVVTGNLIQMSDYYRKAGTYGPFAFTTFADNDLDLIGANKINGSYKIAPKKDRTNQEFWAQYGKYYTYDGHPNNPPYGLCMTYVYPNILRYNTVAELTATGVTEIGSWTVA